MSKKAKRRDWNPLGEILGNRDRNQDRCENRHDNGLHKGWYKEASGRKNPQVDGNGAKLKIEGKERD